MADHVGYLFPIHLHDNSSINPSWGLSTFYSNVGSGWESSPLIKGSASNTQPVVENLINHIGYREPSFFDDFYNRIIISPSNINVGNLVSEQFYEISVFNGYFVNKNLDTLTTQDADGISITGPLAPVTYGPLETKNYQITVGTEGPPSINALLNFNFEGTSDDIILSIAGARIVILPYQAEAPFIEILEWKTNVLTTNSGYEQRIKLRKKARQSINASYPIPSRYLAKAFNMAYGWATRSWAVAMWSETQYIGTVSPGSTSIYCDTTNFDIRANSLVSLWESEDHNEVVEVDSVFSTSISLKRTLNVGYNNAVLMPVRIGVATGGINRDTNGYKSNLNIEYEFKDNIDLNPSAPTQYGSYDIYYEESLMPSELISDKIHGRLDIVDFETGVVDYFPPWLNIRRARSVLFLNDGSEEAWTFKKWLYRRSGKLRPYWLPTFENNLRLAMAGNVGSTLQCYSDDYRSLGSAHNHIAIQYTDGSWHPRLITGHSLENAELINVAIDSPLNVDALLIKQICFLTLMRLDTDRVEIEWIGNSVNRSTLRILEIAP